VWPRDVVGILVFSEEVERLNVWTAYLNTEFLYGSQAAVDELISWAMQHGDPVEVQRRVISVYERAGKIDVSKFHGISRSLQLLKLRTQNLSDWLVVVFT
jgi:hypothetical protein